MKKMMRRFLMHALFVSIGLSGAAGLDLVKQTPAVENFLHETRSFQRSLNEEELGFDAESIELLKQILHYLEENVLAGGENNFPNIKISLQYLLDSAKEFEPRQARIIKEIASELMSKLEVSGKPALEEAPQGMDIAVAEAEEPSLLQAFNALDNFNNKLTNEIMGLYNQYKSALDRLDYKIKVLIDLLRPGNEILHHGFDIIKLQTLQQRIAEKKALVRAILRDNGLL